MREIPLTKNQVALVDDEDFERVNQYRWHASFQYSSCKYCARRNSGSKIMGLPQFVLGIPNPGKGHGIKPLDGNPLNCCKDNLRFVEKSRNMQGSKAPHRTKTSRFTGVCWSKRDNLWLSQIGKNYQVFTVGRFDKEIDAARAYNAKAIELYGSDARLNEVTNG